MADRTNDPERRKQILEAAHRLFIRYGFRKATMDEIAEEAGVGKGTIYYYFRSKKDLLLAYADQCLESIQLKAFEAVEFEGHFVEKLSSLMSAKLLGIWDHVHAGPHGEEIFHSLFPTLVGRLEQSICKTQQRIQELLLEAEKKGIVRLENPEQTAHLIHKSFQGFAPPYSSLSGTREEIAKGIQDLSRLLYEGLR